MNGLTLNLGRKENQNMTHEGLNTSLPSWNSDWCSKVKYGRSRLFLNVFTAGNAETSFLHPIRDLAGGGNTSLGNINVCVPVNM